MYNKFSIVEFQSATKVSQKNSKPQQQNMFQFTSMMKMPHFIQVSKRGRKRKHPIDESQVKMTIKSTEIFMGNHEWFSYEANGSNNEKPKVVSNSNTSNVNACTSILPTTPNTCDNTTSLLPKKKLKQTNLSSNFPTPCSTSNMPPTSTNMESETSIIQKICVDPSLSFPTTLESKHMRPHSCMPHISLIGNSINLTENTHLIVALVTTNNATIAPPSNTTNVSKIISTSKTPTLEGSNILPSSNTTSRKSLGRTSISIRELLN